MEQVHKKFGYSFVFSSSDINTKRRVSLSLANARIDTAVRQILRGQPNVEYNLKGKTVIISKDSPETSKSKDSNQTDKSVHKVTGRVVDEKGEPIIGASVKEEGTKNGTITDFNGNFVISATSKNPTLSISYVGYATQQINLRDGQSSVIKLTENLKKLDELVVIGYGTQKKADLTGAVANIGADKLNTQSNTTIGQALQGKIAGVDIVSQGGSPGSGTRIMVRGIGTLNNASPLYIVDGMYMSDIDHLNPNDIESIDVLKDASSAAIYGSRAANGVIIVTTKSGSNTEGKPIIDLSANIGVQTPAKYLKMMNAQEWADVTTISRKAVGLEPLDMATDLQSKEDNDWQKIMMRPALMQNYNLTIRGGTKYFTYYTGLGYMNQDGIIKGTDYQRYNAQFKSEYNRGWFKFGNNVVFSAQQNNPLYSYSRGGYLGIILQAVPTMSQYDPTNEVSGYGKAYGDVTDVPNPLGILDKDITRRGYNAYTAYINLYAELTLPFGLKYKINATPDLSFDRSTAYENIYDFGLRNNAVSNMQEYRYQNTNFLIEHLLSYNKTFGKHKINALLGYSYQSYKSRYIYASGKALPTGIYEVGAATKDRMNNTSLSESALTSIISRIFYSYNDRYLLTLTYRRDGSSKFAKDNRYGHFPSVSVGWNIVEEKFMQGTKSWLNQLKLRGGYGVLGNQEISNYMYTSVVTSNINYPDGKGGLLNGAFPKEFANPAIRWEETAMTNVGLDFMTFNSRLAVTLDWYTKHTKDVLLTVPIPISTGGANDPVRNAGKIKNTGFEWTVSWNDRPTNDFAYGLTFTGSAMKNEVLALGEEDQVINAGTNYTGVTTTKTLVGYPIGGFWLIPTQGLFQNEAEISAYSKDGNLIQPNAKPGDVRFIDSNNDGKITDDDRVYCGSPFPNLTLGLNFNMSYKQFDFLLGLQGVFGNKIYNDTRWTLEGVTKGVNFLTSVLDYWTPENPNASHPRLVWDDPNSNMRPQSDRFLESGSYVRLRNLQIGYTFPTKWFDNKIQKLRVYMSGENLFTITGYSGYTPDISNGGVTSRGFDSFVYPTNRVFMLGLNLTF